MRKLFIILIILLTLVCGAFATPVNFTNFTVYGSDAWIATNGTHNIIKWNSTTGVHSWLSTGNATTVTYLIQAGGGGAYTGAGGAGGLLTGTTSVSGLINSIIVGAGGSGGSGGTSGSNSTFGTITSNISAKGGGKGVGSAGTDGGSGGGGGGTGAAGGNGIAGQGHNGGSGYADPHWGGGGGGAGVAGTNGASGGAGGDGLWNQLLDDAYAGEVVSGVRYIGGGGGGATSTSSPGGKGGGGAGQNSPGISGLSNTGGGGGGIWTSGGGSGGSGLVLIEYKITNFTLQASFTQSQNPSAIDQVVTFTDISSGDPTTYNWTLAGTSPTNTTQNAAYTYTTTGIYNILLNVTNSTGSWSNTSQTHTVVNASGFTPQDIWMEGQYVQTFHVTDSSTGLPIPVVQLQDTAMNTFTTSNGTGYLTEQFGSSSVTFVATGYTSRAISYVFDSDATWDVQLTATVPGGTPSSQSYPVYVAIHFVEGFGTPVPGVAITATPFTTSTGSFAYLAALLGIPLDQVPIQNQTMNQTSGTDGKGAFYVLPTTQYNFTFSKTGYTFTPPFMFTSFKNDQDIYIAATSSGSPTYFPNGGVDVNSAISYSVSVVAINETASFLNMTYNDSTSTTTGGTVVVIQQNNTPYQPNTTVASWDITSASCSNSTVIVHTQPVSGTSYANIATTQFGNLQRSISFSMKGQAVKFMGFGPEIALLFALFIMMMTVMLGTAQTARQVTFGGLAFEMWVFYAIGWFDSLVARGVPETALLLGMTIVTIVAIFAIFEIRKKKEKY